MSEMVERVARAIFADLTSFVEVTWESRHDSVKEVYRQQARTAIAAMREPSGHMVQMGVETLAKNRDAMMALELHPDRSEMARGKMRLRWQAMIDAVLTSPTDATRSGK